MTAPVGAPWGDAAHVAAPSGAARMVVPGPVPGYGQNLRDPAAANRGFGASPQGPGQQHVRVNRPDPFRFRTLTVMIGVAILIAD
jgi:hypothetical protein